MFNFRQRKAPCGHGVAVKENQKVICVQKYLVIILKTYGDDGVEKEDEKVGGLNIILYIAILIELN